MSGINYSQCWEDSDLLEQALDITAHDTVLSITSGGDNSLALLLRAPKKIFMIDKNPIQNYLTELKLRAPQILDHAQYLEFLGVRESKNRLEYFKQVSHLLSLDASTWFLQHGDVIAQGVMHSGKFERYLNTFRKFLLPRVHSKQTVFEFINQANLEKQITFYNQTWNTWRWRLFFRLASNASLLKKYARQVGTLCGGVIADTNYFKRLERLIYRSHLKHNYYLHYSLCGTYGESCPNYLLETNHRTLGACDPSTYEFHTDDILSFLKKTPNNSLTKFNLSDSFEFLAPEEAAPVWNEIVRTSKNGAVVAYWCNQMEHVPPHELKSQVVRNADLERTLTAYDRLYFYQSFHIYTIVK